MSLNPNIREIAHFEGHLTPEVYHYLNIRPIPEDQIQFMKREGIKQLNVTISMGNPTI